MNLYSNVSERMDYIQKLFLKAGTQIQKNGQDELIAFLETEPPEYRSIAYEGASYEIAMEELKSHQQPDRWKQFRKHCAGQHTFHMDIGLGWAFAKTGLPPDQFLINVQPLVKLMVFDGMGYYYGLFKGRSTLKNKEIPDIECEGLRGFDQGLGRRLWYMAKGDINAVNELVQKFPASRHPDLFRGIGIACGYVGGNDKDALESLFEISGANKKQLQLGVVLAAVSRIASETISESINMACGFICKKTMDELKMTITKMGTNLFYLYNDSPSSHDWLTQLESELLQTNNATPSL